MTAGRERESEKEGKGKGGEKRRGGKKRGGKEIKTQNLCDDAVGEKDN